jgi:hypothetical protein
LLLLPFFAQANQLVAQVDRTEVEMGDILHLTVIADFQTSQSPDFSLLKDQFDILGQQQSHNLQLGSQGIVSETRWEVQLLPKLPGVLMIPPLSLGKLKTQPIKIRVSEASLQGEQKTAFLQASVSTAQPYVQQEVVYTLRLFYRGQLIDGNLRAPSFKGSLNQLTKNQFPYAKRIGGVLYNVYEWQYHLFPQRSGDWTLDAAQFQGRLQTLAGQLKILQLHTRPLTLKVKPIPAAFPTQAQWLPAYDLNLKTLPLKNQSFQVGDSIPLTVTVKAIGLMSSQLPKITLPAGKNYKVYLDHADVEQNLVKGHLVSEKTFHFLVVPLKTGPLNLPKLTLPWWNLRADRLQQAETALPRVDVQPGTASPLAGTPSASQPSVARHPAKPEANRQTADTEQAPPMSGWIWVFILITSGMALLFAALWLKTRLQLQKALKMPQNAEDSLQNSEAAAEKSQNPQSWQTFCSSLDATSMASVTREELLKLYQASQSIQAQAPSAYQTLKAHLYAQPQDSNALLKAVSSLCQALSEADKPQKKPKKFDKNTRLEQLYP